MSSRLALNLVLACVVAALAWLSLTGDDPGPPADVIAVTNLDPASITRIRIAASGRAGIELVRDGDTWRLLSPLAAAADPFRVRTLLDLAAATSSKGFRAAGNDLSQFGLEPAKATVHFDGQLLQFGSTDPVEKLRYVLADGQVHLIEDRWFSQVFGEAAAWLDPRLLGDDQHPVGIELPDARWRLDGGRWQRSPALGAADADAGARLARAWREARALSVRAVDPALPWSGTVRIAVEGSDATLQFTLAATGDALFLSRADLAVQYRFLARQGAALLGRTATARE